MATNIDNRDVNRFRTYAGLDTSPESNMNWGDIATEVSKGIGLIKKDRETRKAAIDQAQVDQLKALSEVPDLNNRSLNGIIIDGSDSSKQVTVNMYSELQKGNIKVKDFMLFMQNQKNGYSSMSSAVKNYDGWYTKAKERLGTDENGNIIASDLNIYSNESIDGFGNLNNKKLVPNPVNGQLQLVTMLKDKNGNYTIMPDPNKNPNNFQNPNAINVRMNFEEDRKVLSDQAAQLTDAIAKKITSNQLNGSVSSMEDFRTAPVFSQWKKDSVASLTSSDNDSAQILTQSGGYKFAGSIAEFKEKNPGLSEDLFIKVDTSGDQPVIELTEDQREAARGYADTAIESQLDQIEKIQSPTRDPSRNKKDDRAYNSKVAKGTKIVDSLNSVYSGGQEEVDGALANLFAEAGLRYENFREDGDNFYLRYTKDGPDGTQIREEQKIPKGANKEEFMQNAYQFFNLGGDIDYDTARGKANVGERGYAEVDVDKKGDPIYYKSTKDADGNVKDYLDKDGKPTTNRKDFVIMPAPKKLTADQIKAGEVQKEQEGNTRKITRQRGTQTEAPQEQRDAILSSSTVGSGSNAVLISSYYDEAVNKIGNKLVFDGNEKEMNALEGGIRTAINSAAEARGDLAAAQNIKYSTSGNIITITFKGGTAQLDTKGLKANQLRAAVNKEVDKVLTAILPAQKGGYEGLDYGNK